MDAIDDELFDTILSGPYIPINFAQNVKDPNKIAVKQIIDCTLDNEKKISTDSYRKLLHNHVIKTMI